jgi:sulfite reductase alpha subunit-like flavoprotein
LPAGAEYETGQNLKIYPENTAENELKALKCIGLGKDQIVEFESQGLLLFPTPINVGSLLRKFLDLQGPIKKSQLKSLAQQVRDSQLCRE